MKQLGQYPPPRHTVAHLSDPHLLAGSALQYGVVDTVAGLRHALERVAAVDPTPQVLVFTGDLADKAEPDAYARLREMGVSAMFLALPDLMRSDDLDRCAPLTR